MIALKKDELEAIKEQTRKDVIKKQKEKRWNFVFWALVIVAVVLAAIQIFFLVIPSLYP